MQLFLCGYIRGFQASGRVGLLIPFAELCCDPEAMEPGIPFFRFSNIGRKPLPIPRRMPIIRKL